jgi:phosphate acyltransferase
MVIAVDAAGGDYAPQEIVKGAAEAASGNDMEIVLLGDKQRIDALLEEAPHNPRISVVHCTQEISCNENPVEAVCGRPDSAIVVGVRMVKSGSAAAFVSAGNTGAVMAASYLNLRNVAGIDRPALGVVIPVSTGRPFLLIDGGANVDCQPRFLVQFGLLGDVFARTMMGVESPRVGLLNNGEEEAKGSGLTKETHRLLKTTGLNFVGNIEGQEIFKDKIDVLVTDGFTGNVLLKTMEGFADLLKGVVGAARGKPDGNDVAVGAASGGIAAMIKKMDFSEYGGACLLGVNGNVIVSHGRSKARAVKNAIAFASRAAGSGLLDAIRNRSLQETKPA